MMGSDMDDAGVFCVRVDTPRAGSRTVAWRSPPAPRAGDALGGARDGAGRSTILVVGDSLSAEYGLARGSGWVALLEQRLRTRRIRRRRSSTPASAATPPRAAGATAGAAAQHKPGLVDHRARRQRRAARPAAGDDARQPGRDGARCAQGRRRAGADRRHAACRRTTAAATASDFAALFADGRAAPKAPRWCRSCSRALPTSPQAEAMFQADRIHPLRERAPDHPRQRLAGAAQPLLSSAGPRRGRRYRTTAAARSDRALRALARARDVRACAARRSHVGRSVSLGGLDRRAGRRRTVRPGARLTGLAAAPAAALGTARASGSAAAAGRLAAAAGRARTQPGRPARRVRRCGRRRRHATARRPDRLRGRARARRSRGAAVTHAEPARGVSRPCGNPDAAAASGGGRTPCRSATCRRALRRPPRRGRGARRRRVRRPAPEPAPRSRRPAGALAARPALGGAITGGRASRAAGAAAPERRADRRGPPAADARCRWRRQPVPQHRPRPGRGGGDERARSAALREAGATAGSTCATDRRDRPARHHRHRAGTTVDPRLARRLASAGAVVDDRA